MGKRGSGNGGAGNGRAGRSGGGATGGSAESVKIDVSGLIGSEKQKAYAADILNDHRRYAQRGGKAVKRDVRGGK